MKTIVVTGGIGSGKSAVCDYLRMRGVPVYDCDNSVKRLYDDDPTLVSDLERALGTDLRGEDGRLDRKRLASVIFSDSQALATLESIVHPAVLRDFVSWRSSFDASSWSGYAGMAPFVVMESAIVTEKPVFDGSYDAVVMVTAPDEIRIGRASRRDGVSHEAIAARMANQKFERCAPAAVIVNDSDMETLHARTDKVFSSI